MSHIIMQRSGVDGVSMGRVSSGSCCRRELLPLQLLLSPQYVSIIVTPTPSDKIGISYLINRPSERCSLFFAKKTEPSMKFVLYHLSRLY